MPATTSTPCSRSRAAKASARLSGSGSAVAEIRDRAHLLRLITIYRPRPGEEPVLDRLWQLAWEELR